METEKAVESAVSEQQLEALGLKEAGRRLSRAKRLQAAYRNYQFIPQEKINLFNGKLKKETLTEDKNASRYKRLGFIRLENYPEIPPAHALKRLLEARKAGCFDSFEVCRIEWIEEVKDPILFGRIENCADRFFISQWDDDIKLSDIVFGDTARVEKDGREDTADRLI